MTDNEIIKALECCSHRNEDLPCDGCPAYNIAQMCMEDLMSAALDLINRQKLEIEQWKEETNKYKNLWCIALDDIEIEKVKAYTRITNIKKISRYLDNLVKEMMEVNENE